MSNKLYQSMVNQLKDTIGFEFGISDEMGVVLACSIVDKVGQCIPGFETIKSSSEKIVNLNGFIYEKSQIKKKIEFVAFIKNEENYAIKLLALLSVHVTNLKNTYEEKYDTFNFIKNILLDNILPGDIPIRAKELKIMNDARRVVVLIRTEKPKDLSVYDVVCSLFPNKFKDYVVALDDENTVLVKELKENEDFKEITKISKIIFETLPETLRPNVRVGIGTGVDRIKDIGRSFKDAQMALLVGGIFEKEKQIINYNNLGIGRLIYQLPKTLCRLFLKEIFKDDFFEKLDSESMTTVTKFFENNLNVSETSRQLFVHRNTLVYRLDKIQKTMGLDLRSFDDAIIFKVALMVKKYLDNGERY